MCRVNADVMATPGWANAARSGMRAFSALRASETLRDVENNNPPLRHGVASHLGRSKRRLCDQGSMDLHNLCPREHNPCEWRDHQSDPALRCQHRLLPTSGAYTYTSSSQGG